MTVATLVALAVVALVAFGTEGAIGFGGTVIAASLGSQFVPLEVLLPAFVPLNLALSGWLLARSAGSIAWRVLVFEIAPPVAAGMIAGIALAHAGPQRVLALGFGSFVIVLAVLQLARPATRPLSRVARLLLLIAGGVAHGIFGTGGPMIVYVARRRIADKRAFRGTLAVLWLVLNSVLLASFVSLDRYGEVTFEIGVVLALAIVPGLWIGERLHHALDAARFERVVWSVLLVAGLALVVRCVSG